MLQCLTFGGSSLFKKILPNLKSETSKTLQSDSPAFIFCYTSHHKSNLS